jgi:predicted MPP superfamily phosphohydrolase
MKAGWLSDIHLDACAEHRIERLIDEVLASECGLVLLGGDISNAHALEHHLSLMARRIELPIYFVLGNHDFYGSNFDSVEALSEALSDTFSNLHFLTAVELPTLLLDNVALIGCGDFADGRLGNYQDSPVLLNDFRLIDDLSGWSREAQLCTLNKRGDRAAHLLDERLDRLSESVEYVIVLLHVPPFANAAWHEGAPSNDDFLPYFSCKAVGDVLMAHFSGKGSRKCLALCGHTHGSGEYAPTSSMKVLTAGAEYGAPAVQKVFELDRLDRLFAR